MKNRVSGHIERFNREFGGKVDFRTDDLMKIAEVSGGDSFNLLHNALKVGFIIGYNKAKAETKKRNK